MNTNQIFNWNRFTATLRKELAENWRTMVLVMAGIYLWYSISMIIANVTTLEGSYSINPLFFSLIAAIMAGMAFRHLKTQQGRVHFLTSPSSTLEKYVVNLLLYFVGAFVIFAISFQLADITRYLVMSFISSKLEIFNTLPTNLVNQYDSHHFDRDDIFLVVEALGVGAAFFLSSVMWPRRSSLKMGVVILVIVVIQIAIAGYCSYQFLGRDRMAPSGITASFFNQLATVGIWFDVIVYTLCLVLTWFVLKHKDVITLKWWK